jgi:hypothetical protein
VAKHTTGTSDMQHKTVDSKNQKDKLIQEEIQKLNEIFRFLPADKKELCEGLIQNAALMKATLCELQEEVNEHGAMISCQSGNGFKTIKDNPAQKAYATMISRYISIIDQLTSYLPSNKQTAAQMAGEQFAEMVAKGKKKVDLSEFS